MPNYHPYFISSLPFLQFGMKAPLEFKRFLELASDSIPKSELTILENCADIIEEPQKYKYNKKNIVKIWRDFEFMLRNELVKVRAKRLHKDAVSFLRSGLDAGPLFAHAIGEIARQPHPLEAERLLDMLRWNKLDELCFGHYFDIEFLFVYAQKLLILERWDNIRSAQKQKLLNSVLEETARQA
ncbi:MAG: DUF2764 domain-containing protein [Candidatus Omnitrophica bacterium]|jgi:hypothetical protein|nr:DUF2764 domain-containing protein [Candidatus Omnitrophota bacterium]